MVNLGRSIATTLLKDTETRLIIPSKEQLFLGLVGGITTNIVGALRTDNVTTEGLVQAGINSLLQGPLLTLGVTEISVGGKLILAKTKGIGSVGSILHILGSDNEEIKLKFTTKLFPGPMGSILKKMLKLTLDSADLVYVVDDLLAVAPCILLDYHIKKVGKLKTAIMGELILEGLPVSVGIGGFKGAALTGLTAIAPSVLSNTTSQLAQPFKWMGDILSEKRNRG